MVPGLSSGDGVGANTTPQQLARPSAGSHKRGMDEIAQQLAMQVSEQLPAVLEAILRAGHDPASQPLHLECSLTTPGQGSGLIDNRLPVAAVNISNAIVPFNPSPLTESSGATPSVGSIGLPHVQWQGKNSTTPATSQAKDPDLYGSERPTKRARQRYDIASDAVPTSAVQRNGNVEPARKKRIPTNPALQPSTFDKFITGIWDSIYSSIRMDPAEVIEQWQAIESSGQPKLLTEDQHEVTTRNSLGNFGRMNILTRKISQTGKTFRSLEIIVQAHWVQCFDDRVAELATEMPREKAKRAAMSEACGDFGWTDKELRNKTAIWRGYSDIKDAAGWVALVFASTGLYRFSKYSLTNETFDKLRALRHRFELAADTCHPKWRVLLGIIGAPTERKYIGHPHDWVVEAGDEAIPLAPTYYQWDPNFSYKHLDGSVVDEEAWGGYDPRTVMADTDPAMATCQSCGEHQSDDPRQNVCSCYANLYGCSKPNLVPLQIFRTPNGKNNGLLACCPIEKGLAVGEFVGEITSGLAGLDVMIGETDQATYQIWQGRQGNHTKFVNHSCAPNSHFERFVWLGKQRIVLASLGIEAGGEVTVDYGETYWHNLDKECKCGQPCCRYKDRRRQVDASPERRQLLGGAKVDGEDSDEEGNR
ncbi:uncharacterized protein LTR77_002453 [Saxophila tyrrhenica]|uniref:SET domain-containing protein n=1 Tax=Saxophila tyrrhenica TaxID=1690608 RepID=A0AAV9PL86_9PEZI|nr:hypothetical protein LTR77_002453 [Saxophila tyrrhenica]